MKTIEVKKGEETSALKVAVEIIGNIRDNFEYKIRDDIEGKIFGAGKTVATKSFRITYKIEYTDESN